MVNKIARQIAYFMIANLIVSFGYALTLFIGVSLISILIAIICVVIGVVFVYQVIEIGFSNEGTFSGLHKGDYISIFDIKNEKLMYVKVLSSVSVSDKPTVKIVLEDNSFFFFPKNADKHLIDDKMFYPTVVVK